MTMQEKLDAVVKANTELLEAWDEELVEHYPGDELGNLEDVFAAIGSIRLWSEEDALLYQLERKGIEAHMEDGSGAIFVYMKSSRVGIDYNLGGAWNVQYYPNVGDSDSVGIGFNWSRSRDVSAKVHEVVEELVPLLEAWGVRRSGVDPAPLDCDEALTRIADTIDSTSMQDEEKLTAIAIFTNQAGHTVHGTRGIGQELP